MFVEPKIKFPKGRAFYFDWGSLITKGTFLPFHSWQMRIVYYNDKNPHCIWTLLPPPMKYKNEIDETFISLNYLPWNLSHFADESTEFNNSTKFLRHSVFKQTDFANHFHLGMHFGATKNDHKAWEPIYVDFFQPWLKIRPVAFSQIFLRIATAISSRHD